MQNRTLGKTGFSISEIGLGCWQLGGDFGPVGDEAATQILTNARDLGVNFWDTADVYGGGVSESRIAPVLAESEGTFVVTKVGRNGELYPDQYTKAKVRDSLIGSRDRLGVRSLDLAQLHCVPRAVLEDGEIFSWLEDFKAEGLIKNYGASVETVEEGLLCLRQPGLATLQIIFNIFRQDAAVELLPAAKAANVGIIVRLPLASGLLSGKFTQNHTFAESDHRNYNRDGAAFSVGETFSGIAFEKGVELVNTLKQIKPEHLTMSEFALRWILDHDAVSSIIAGVSKPEQLAGNVAASAHPKLSDEVHAQLRDFYENSVRAHIRGAI